MTNDEVQKLIQGIFDNIFASVTTAEPGGRPVMTPATTVVPALAQLSLVSFSGVAVEAQAVLRMPVVPSVSGAVATTQRLTLAPGGRSPRSQVSALHSTQPGAW